MPVGADPEIRLETGRERLQALSLVIALDSPGFAQQPVGLESEAAADDDAGLKTRAVDEFPGGLFGRRQPVGLMRRARDIDIGPEAGKG